MTLLEERAHNRHVQQRVATQRIARELADHMLEDLVLSEGERLRLHGIIYGALFTEVSTRNLVASAEALA